MTFYKVAVYKDGQLVDEMNASTKYHAFELFNGFASEAMLNKEEGMTFAITEHKK